jgi:hypothetical protein
MCIAFIQATVDSERLGRRPTDTAPLAVLP